MIKISWWKIASISLIIPTEIRVIVCPVPFHRELKQRRRRRVRKRYLKSDFALLQTFLRLVHLAQFVKCWQKKANTNEYDISSITALRTEISLSLSCMAFSVNEVVRVACDSRSLDWQRTRTTLWTLYAIDSNDKPKKGFEPSQLNFAFSFYLPKTETCAWITKKRIHHMKKRTTNFANHHVMDALSFRIITSSVRSVKKKKF